MNISKSTTEIIKVTNGCYINPFVPNAPFLYLLKTSENLTVFCCFHGVEKGCIENININLAELNDYSV